MEIILTPFIVRPRTEELFPAYTDFSTLPLSQRRSTHPPIVHQLSSEIILSRWRGAKRLSASNISSRRQTDRQTNRRRRRRPCWVYMGTARYSFLMLRLENFRKMQPVLPRHDLSATPERAVVGSHHSTYGYEDSNNTLRTYALKNLNYYRMAVMRGTALCLDAVVVVVACSHAAALGTPTWGASLVFEAQIPTNAPAHATRLGTKENELVLSAFRVLSQNRSHEHGKALRTFTHQCTKRVSVNISLFTTQKI